MSPDAVLLDVGGVFHLPEHETVLGAFARAGVGVDPRLLDRAHYAATTAFVTDYDGDLPWDRLWRDYLGRYCRACGTPDHLLDEAHAHVDAEFATAALWSRVIPGSRDGLRTLAATGVRVGVVSNSDGSVAARLREQEVLQVGPGPGVQVECIVDSGEVGVSKPDPRIFAVALDALGLPPERVWYVGDMPGIDVVGARAAGIRPLVMDPFGFHRAGGFETVESLEHVARRAAGS